MYHLPAGISFPLVGGSMLAARTGTLRMLPDGRLRTLLSFPLTIRRIRNELLELASSVDRVITLTEWYKKILIRNGVAEERIVVVPTAPAVAGIVLPRKDISRPDSPLKIIFIGRLHPQKGVHHLIEAVEGFTRKQVVVDIYGKDEGDDYGRQCKQQGATVEAIRFAGQLDREKVLPTLTEYDILCLPSISSEMSPLVIQEAFAAGIPALVSHSYGNIEQVKHDQNGLVFDFNSPSNLREQIDRLIREPGLLARLRDQVRPPGDFNRISNAYLELYHL
jgi:glycosyltransferase involved in cell wall biosynthesis